MKLAGGFALLLAGVVCLAVTPVVDPLPWIVMGWSLLLIGVAVVTPVLVDWVER
jgi:hypothetical protein